MFGQQNGLSLDQAPPLFVLFGFFMVASLFGMAGGIVIATHGATIITDPSVRLPLIHIFTLGIIASFMIGSLFQMLPVIAGVTLAHPLTKSLLFGIPFVMGTLGLVAVLGGYGGELLPRAVFWVLGFSLMGLVMVMLWGLLRLHHHSPSSRGMTLAVGGFGLTVLMGLGMIGVHGGYFEGGGYGIMRSLHSGFGLGGWIALLIISISFQVIEMFYVTPPYPPLMARTLTGTIFTLLILKIPLVLSDESLHLAIDIPIGLLLIGYGLTTLRRLHQRKRSVNDASLWFWRIGMGSLIVAVFLGLIPRGEDGAWVSWLFSLFFVTFAVSIVFAMFYKIIPFLTWFHLNAQGYYEAPMMHEVIPPKYAKHHLKLHLFSLITLLIAPLYLPLFGVAGVAVILSFGAIAFHIIHATRLYRKTQREGKKFDFGVS